MFNKRRRHTLCVLIEPLLHYDNLYKTQKPMLPLKKFLYLHIF